MVGHLRTVTGIPSHGKSNFLEWYILNLLAENDYKASFFSPEHSPYELHQSNFIQKFYGRSFWSDKGGARITKSEINDYIEWANEKIYITCPDKSQSPSWDFIFETFRDQMYAYGINIVVIDAFNKVLFNDKGNKLDMINEVLTRLTSFAQKYNVAIFLVAHPTKMKKNEVGKYEKPSLYDVSGSADFRNQTHDGFCIYRDDDWTSFVNLKTKESFQGEIGSEERYKWHSPSGRYFHVMDKPSTEPLVKFNEQKPLISENEYANYKGFSEEAGF